jgi:hypothetical protein
LNHVNFKHILASFQPMRVDTFMWQVVHIHTIVKRTSVGGGRIFQQLILSKPMISISFSLSVIPLLDLVDFIGFGIFFMAIYSSLTQSNNQSHILDTTNGISRICIYKTHKSYKRYV